jgi:pyruvate kinase
MEYEIIATLGPNSDRPEIWQNMINAGVTAFRLNTSHLSLTQLNLWLENIRAFYRTARLEHPLVLDLQGSKWRLGKFDPFELLVDQEIRLIFAAASAKPLELPVPHLDFFEAASSSSRVILLNDAKVRLEVLDAGAGTIQARVTQEGSVSSAKGITYLASDYRKEDLNDKDREILQQTGGLDYVRYAVSYVRDAAEMANFRSLTGSSKYMIAKLERKTAIEQAVHIAEHSNELWLCRGDLGAELGIKSMANSVYHFSETVRNLHIPVMMAGQVLEHMTTEAAPTRSEICYLHDALQKGFQGFVLSDETAIGQYPVECCQAATLFKNE